MFDISTENTHVGACVLYDFKIVIFFNFFNLIFLHFNDRTGRPYRMPGGRGDGVPIPVASPLVSGREGPLYATISGFFFFFLMSFFTRLNTCDVHAPCPQYACTCAYNCTCQNIIIMLWRPRTNGIGRRERLRRLWRPDEEIAKKKKNN